MRSILWPLLLVIGTHVHAQSLLGGGDGTTTGIPIGSLIGSLDLNGLLNTSPVDHPRDFEPRLLFGAGMSIQQAELMGSAGGADASTLPAPGGSLEFGGSLLYRDHFGLALQGTWGFTGYRLMLDDVENRLYHSSKRVEARLWWSPSARRDHARQFKLGLGMGWTFQQADELAREDDDYRALTTAPHSVRPYIAPEIGVIGSEGKDRLELSLRYMIYVDGMKGWETNASLGTSNATYTASDNCIGFVTRYHIGFHRKTPPVSFAPAIPYTDRHTDTLTTVRTRMRRITMRLWDDAEVDGDTISVFLNEEPVLYGLELSKKHVRLVLDLRRGNNYLMVVAHNEGAVSPNTARVIVRRGKGKEQLLIKTSRKHNQLVVIRNE